MEMKKEELNKKLEVFIIDSMFEGESMEISDDLHLLEYGIIDSMSIMNLIAFIDDEFDIRISSDDITPENFASINSISDLVIESNK